MKRPDFKLLDCTEARVGDVLHIAIAATGQVFKQLPVAEIRGDFLYCQVPGMPDAEGWYYGRKDGVEWDEELKWGTKYGIIATIVVKIEPGGK